MAHDGYGWAIEGRSGTRYRVVTRINAHDEPFKEAARVLLRLSGMRIPIEMEPAETVRKMQDQVPERGPRSRTTWRGYSLATLPRTVRGRTKSITSSRGGHPRLIRGSRYRAKATLDEQARLNLRIVGYRITGELRRSESPLGRRSFADDVIVGVPVAVNFLVEVRQVVVEASENGAAASGYKSCHGSRREREFGQISGDICSPVFAATARIMIELASLPVPEEIEALSNQVRRAPLPNKKPRIPLFVSFVARDSSRSHSFPSRNIVGLTVRRQSPATDS